MMNKNLQNLIKDKYGFSNITIVEAPRQFVAKTYFITDENSNEYFCKIVKKQKFIPRIIQSLPILNNLYQSGLMNINYPIQTTNGELYIKDKNTLIVFFNKIDATQTFKFDNSALGGMIGKLHNIEVNDSINIPTENFSVTQFEKYKNNLTRVINDISDDPIRIKLKEQIVKYQLELEFDFDNFTKISNKLQSEKHSLVITHGDAPGNVLVGSNDEISLIDWDDIKLAPPERDLYFFDGNKEFMSGYSDVLLGYQINQDLLLYYIYLRYFVDIDEFIDEIWPKRDEKHRLENLEELKSDCFEDWLRPWIRSIVVLEESFN